MNTRKLRARIIEAGFTVDTFATKIGISAASMRNKLSSRTAFTQREIQEIALQLSFNRDDIMDIFFEEKVS